LDESFADSLQAVVEGTGVLPVAEFDGAVGGGNAA